MCENFNRNLLKQHVKVDSLEFQALLSFEAFDPGKCDGAANQRVFQGLLFSTAH